MGQSLQGRRIALRLRQARLWTERAATTTPTAAAIAAGFIVDAGGR
jgi:hypothetical protein